MPTVTFVKEKRTIEVPAGANLRKAARKAGIQLYPGIHKYVNCLGWGLCGTCCVIIKQGMEHCSRPKLREKIPMSPLYFAARLGHEKEIRLACQTRVNGDIEVETQPPPNWHGEKFWG
jgi:ferredoxin